jgi:hypothetical protein
VVLWHRKSQIQTVKEKSGVVEKLFRKFQHNRGEQAPIKSPEMQKYKGCVNFFGRNFYFAQIH